MSTPAQMSGLREDHDGWTLPLAGRVVDQVCIDFSVTLVVEGADTLRLSGVVYLIDVGTDDEDEIVERHPRRDEGAVRTSPRPTRTDRQPARETTVIDLTAGPSPVELIPLIGLHRAVVQEARATHDGTLTVTFVDGRGIAVAPHEDYEAWAAQGGLPPLVEDYEVVCEPGGYVAVR